MGEFNLIEEPWIPCLTLDGRYVEHGIEDTLLKANQLREICDDSPLVTVALHRLLLAVLYRANNGPRDFNEWTGLYDRGGFDPVTVTGYLESHRDRFYLICAKHPFFQMAQLETKANLSITRLATESASGNNATLFDHCSDDEDVIWPFSKAARQLIACQSFALGFGKSGRATIDGKDETLPYSADAIALRGMNIWFEGDNLFVTLMANLAPGDDESLPPWELPDPHVYRDKVDGSKRKSVGSFGVVDRLTWQSRLVRLIPTGKGVSRMYFTQGRSADKAPGDPMKVYRSSKEQGVIAVSLNSMKAAWRDAHTIFMIPVAGSRERRPECFNLIAKARSAGTIQTDRPFVTQIVGLASAPKKAGKFLLWRHERMPVPAEMLDDVNLIERLGALIQQAENAELELNNRTRRIARLYLSPETESSAGRQPDKADVARITNAIDPRPAYWARLERHFFELIENLPDDWDLVADDWKPENQQSATNIWRQRVKMEAQRALEESVRSLGTTARAIQAIARVRTDFYDQDLKPQSRKRPKENQKQKGGRKNET